MALEEVKEELSSKSSAESSFDLNKTLFDKEEKEKKEQEKQA